MRIIDCGEKYILQFRYDPKLIELVKKIPGRKFDPAAKWWTIPKCITTERYMEHYLGFTFAKPEIPARWNGDIVTNDTIPPFHHQEDITRKLVRKYEEKKGFAVFAETGVGKTRSFVDFVQTVRGRIDPDVTCIIVCPAPLLGVWETQFRDFGGIQVNRIHGRQRNIPSNRHPKVSITSYDTLAMDINKHNEGCGYDIAIFDESQLCKSHRTRRAKTCKKLRATRKYILTGTPYGNEFADIWSQMELVDVKALGTKDVFASAFCIFGGYEGKEIVGYQNIPLLLEIVKRYSVTVKKSDCLDIPEKIYQKIDIEMNKAQEAIYKRILKGGLLDMPISNQLQAISKLRQVSSGFAYTDGAPLLLKTGKVDYLRSVSWGTPTIIWYNYDMEATDIALALSEIGVSYLMANGSNQAFKAVRDFEAGKGSVIIAQIQSLQYGFTVNRATRSIYYSGTFSALQRSQSEDRNHRVGQNASVIYIDLLSSPIERWIHQACMEKRDTLQFILENLTKNEKGVD